jgi:hypoxanthine phosphoribosyltransferase
MVLRQSSQSILLISQFVHARIALRRSAGNSRPVARNRKEPAMKTLITENELHEGVARLAQQISEQYRGKPLMMIGILQDSIVLMADLMRMMDIPSQVRIVQPVVDHVGPERPTRLFLDMTTAEAIHNHHILIVDDVLDTGFTLRELMYQVDEVDPMSVRSAVLLCKRGRRKTLAGPNYVVFEIPDEIVVGYGLDYQGRYRRLSHIAAIEPQDASPQPCAVLPSTSPMPEFASV